MFRLPAALLVTGLCAAQGALTFAPHHPMFRLEVHDLPGLLAAARNSAIGRLMADEEVAEAWEIGKQRYLEHAGKWLEIATALQRLAPRSATLGDRTEALVRSIDWRDIHGFSICASLPGDELGQDAPGLDMPGYLEPMTTVTLQPTAAAEARLQQVFAEFVADLHKNMPPGVTAAPDQRVAGQPGLWLLPDDAADPMAQPALFVSAQTMPIWATARPGLLAGGTGPPEIGTFRAAEPRPPSFRLGVDLGRYMKMMVALIGNPSDIDESLAATGMQNAGMLEWRLSCVEDRVQDDLSLAFNGPIGGILGAMLTGMAPLPPQPLPERGLVQLRCTFDVKALAAAVDKLLTLADLRTLTEQGMLEDLRRAWTGGATLGLTRPALGALVPRLYASFGIVDREALDRLLARLKEQPFVNARQRELSGTECTLLEIDDLPSGLQPAYCLRNGTIHFAESAQSLRALLKAEDDGAPTMLDVGDAPRPDAAGILMPNFDLRFDGAEIHTAMHEIWLPLIEASMVLLETEPFVTMDEMPEVETVTNYLRKGRGVLRRTPDGIVLSMSGTLGGPETQALALMYGPVFSTSIAQSQVWERDELRSRLTNAQMLAVHAAIEAFKQREGQRPASLGALLAAGDLSDDGLLLVVGDELAEPVLHEGQPVAMSSFRYYPEGLTVSPDGNEVKALLIAIKKGPWWRNAIDLDGQVHQGWGEFADKPIDELEKDARQGGKRDHEHK